MTGPSFPDAWPDVRTLFEAALLRDPEEREAFLDAACADKPELRRQVAALLAVWNEDAGRFDQSPPVQLGGPATATSNAAGRAIGPYIVRDELGQGGMGIVYLADDLGRVREELGRIEGASH